MRRIAFTGLALAAVLASGVYGFGMGRLGWPPAADLEAGLRMLSPTFRPQSWAERHYSQRAAYYRSLPGTAPNVMLGDSLTEAANWDELIPGANIINRGISGDTCEGLLKRLDEVISRRPKRVFILCGTNDVGAEVPDDRVAATVAEMAKALRAAGAEPIIQSVPLTSWSSRNTRTGTLNDRLRAAAREMNLRYIDLNPALAPGDRLLPHLTTDGVHLTGAAYRLWADEIRKSLDAES